ncbi:helix-hairpin-helix domain-containing protein [Gulosibacter sediminis]|uniref:helix-hairpin-helix domain-containing protein n=1 Tax=Gulosibacter sediminis TaxID=1729695 RepID=UPI002E2B1E3E|nr:helix-hairpin-helix domain-containing protein [Gulosibacter sediminis]
MHPESPSAAPVPDDEWLRVPWAGLEEFAPPGEPPEDAYLDEPDWGGGRETRAPRGQAFDGLAREAVPRAHPESRGTGGRAGARVGDTQGERDAAEERTEQANKAAALLADDELDQLFAAPQRPRWKLGLGAVVVLALVVCAIVVLAIALQPRANAIPDLEELGDGATPAATGGAAPGVVAEPGASEAGTVLVHVAGAVNAPGVYELAAGDRVIDAIEAAGGVTDAADAEQLNFARPLVDGEQIYVPEPGEAPPVGSSDSGGGSAGGGGSSGGLINLNTASATELETLPRIGPAMSQRIIDYREQNGGFTSIDQLKDVAGIGEATFDGLKELVTV